MGSKAQHSRRYQKVPQYLRRVRDDAQLTQRQLGEILGKPHSWIYNSETGNRRVDVAEFAEWVEACGLDATGAFAELVSQMGIKR